MREQSFWFIEVRPPKVFFSTPPGDLLKLPYFCSGRLATPLPSFPPSYSLRIFFLRGPPGGALSFPAPPTYVAIHPQADLFNFPLVLTNSKTSRSPEVFFVAPLFGHFSSGQTQIELPGLRFARLFGVGVSFRALVPGHFLSCFSFFPDPMLLFAHLSPGAPGCRDY